MIHVEGKAGGYLGYAMWRRSLLIASGATDMQVTNQMGHSKIETTKNIYGHLFAQDRASVLGAMNQAVSRLYACENHEPGPGEDKDAEA